VAYSTESLSQHLSEIWHVPVHILLRWSKKVSACDDEAQINFAISDVLGRARPTVSGSQGDVAEQDIEARDKRHGEISGIYHVVDVVVFEWRLLDRLAQRVDGGVEHGHCRRST
jgi:hypothetical protein